MATKRAPAKKSDKAQLKPTVRDLAPKNDPKGGKMTTKPVMKVGTKTTGFICTGCQSQGDCMS